MSSIWVKATALSASRDLSTFYPRLANPQPISQVPVHIKKPIGAFRGGILGFLFGTTIAGTAGYYYVYEEHKVSSDLLTEDIDALRTSVMRIEQYVRNMEERIADVSVKTTLKK